MVGEPGSQERYFVFECRKYLIGPSGGIVRAQIVVGPTFRELHEQAKLGLDAGQLRDRIAMLGPNLIPYEVDTVSEAAIKEFMTFFYLYYPRSIMIKSMFLQHLERARIRHIDFIFCNCCGTMTE